MHDKFNFDPILTMHIIHKLLDKQNIFNIVALLYFDLGNLELSKGQKSPQTYFFTKIGCEKREKLALQNHEKTKKTKKEEENTKSSNSKVQSLDKFTSDEIVESSNFFLFIHQKSYSNI